MNRTDRLAIEIEKIYNNNKKEIQAFMKQNKVDKTPDSGWSTTGSCTITKAVLKTKVPIMRVYHGTQPSVIVPTLILNQLQEAYIKLFKKERGNRYE